MIFKSIFKSAYFKLTAFYVLIVMVISVGFSVAIYQISSNEIDRGLGRQSVIFRNLTSDEIQTLPLPDFEKIRIEQLSESTIDLKTNLVYFNLLILILSTVASYFLARKTLEPIVNSMESQNRFSADASHELRTPLAAMQTEIEVNLRDKKLTLNKSRALLKSILEEIDKLKMLSEMLLKLARLQEDVKSNFEAVSLENAIVEAFEKIAPLAQKKAIKFDNKFSDISILGDNQSIVELFIILMENSIKYSPNKSKIFLVIKKEKNHAVAKIKDKGCGINAKDMPHIFDRFYRSDNSRCKVKVDGYGLGLAIAKQITELHNGKIVVKSKENEGSEFSLYFPLLKNKAKD